MKIHIPNCPECGAPVAGTMEIVEAIAEVQATPSGHEYTGLTVTESSTQKSIVDAEGLYLVTCFHGHQWKTRIDDITQIYDSFRPSDRETQQGG